MTPRVLYSGANMADPKDIEHMMSTAEDEFGSVDILVHNAGALGRLTPVPHILPEDWAEVIAVNLSAAWHLIRTTDPLLRQSPAGRAVFVGVYRFDHHAAAGGLGEVERFTFCFITVWRVARSLPRAHQHSACAVESAQRLERRQRRPAAERACHRTAGDQGVGVCDETPVFV